MNPFQNVAVSAKRVAGPLALALAIGGAFAAGPARAQDTNTSDTSEYTLKKRVFTAGDVNRYRLAMKVHSGDQDSTVNLQFKETTKEAKPSGEFTLLNQFESAVATIGGTEQDIVSFLPMVTVIRDKGGKLSTKTEGGNEQAASQISSVMQSISTMQEAYLPKKPVKIGDTWKVSVATPGPDGATTKTEGDATLVGTEVVSGIKSVKLKVIADVNNKGSDVKGHTESVMNLDPASGKLVKMSAKVDGTAMGMKITQEIEVSLLAPDSK